MPPNDNQRAMMRRVLSNFLNSGKPTPREDLLCEFPYLDDLNDLVWRNNLLKISYVAGAEQFLPSVWVFHFAGDEQAEDFARKSVQTLVKVLRAQFFKKRNDLSRETLLKEAQTFEPTADAKWIELAINLGCEMNLFQGWKGGNSQQPLIEPVKISEQIVGIKDPDKYWDEFISNYKWLGPAAETQHEEEKHQNVAGRRYYWAYLKRFGKESTETWRRDFGIAFVLALITTVLSWGDRTALEGALLGLDAIVILFGIIAITHLFHTSFLLFCERGHPDHGGIRPIPGRYGVWGAGILLAFVVAVGYGAFRAWDQRQPAIVSRVPAPTAPDITVTQAVSESAAKPAPKQRNGSGSAARVVPPVTPRQNTPQSQSPTQVSAPLPATFLDRVVQENRALTQDDRNRFSTELYDGDQLVKQAETFSLQIRDEFNRLTRDRQSGALATNVTDHIKTLQNLSKLSRDQYSAGTAFQQKWQYFSDQTEYILGDDRGDSVAAAMDSLTNASQGMANSLGDWAKISNKDQPAVLNIEAQQQSDCENYLQQFTKWASVTHQRINQMKQSLDPNATVQPLRTSNGAPAPAVAMF